MMTNEQRARRVIDAVIQEHGNEVFLGDGYAPDATLFDGIVAALTSPPAPSGWQQRIAAMDPWAVFGYRSHCFFCRVAQEPDTVHKPDCLWQNAKDACALKTVRENR